MIRAFCNQVCKTQFQGTKYVNLDRPKPTPAHTHILICRQKGVCAACGRKSKNIKPRRGAK